MAALFTERNRSPLRRRMIEDPTILGFTVSTQEALALPLCSPNETAARYAGA